MFAAYSFIVGVQFECFAPELHGFGAKLAYTVDGADLGKISFENLNSAEARITVTGVSDRKSVV